MIIRFDTRDEAINYIRNSYDNKHVFNLIDGKLVKPEIGHGSAYVVIVEKVKPGILANTVTEYF